MLRAMTDRTLLFVHGTGVRNQGYLVSLKAIRDKVKEFNIPCAVDECLWGDALGVDFAGLSLPELPERTPEQEAEAERWEYLQIDPLFDLKLWITPEAALAKSGLYEEEPRSEDDRDAWEEVIESYQPSDGLRAILDRYQVTPLFQPAWEAVVLTELPAKAFEAAGAESAAVARVFAEAVVAQMMHDGAAAKPPESIPFNVRTKIVDRLLFDWEMTEKAVKDLFLKLFGRAAKTVIRPMRSRASLAIAPAIGDILRYQAVGKEIRALIRKKIESLETDVFVCSHSLGGIACVELMAESRPATAKGLITAGSQSPLLYEFDALETLKGQKPLPDFPWLNLYDENDLLSYRADRVFNRLVDKRVDSLLPPLEAHSAYWKLEDSWTAIRDFVQRHR